ncbi:MAG: hypothetical protein HY913_03490 [Desulfomonile tiedjei]|nr:hypothetical protein [Desulfomonile tiedjei]
MAPTYGPEKASLSEFPARLTRPVSSIICLYEPCKRAVRLYSYHMVSFLILAAGFAIPFSASPVAAVEPGGPGAYTRAAYVLAPETLKNGFSLAGVEIPLDKHDVSTRVAEQVNFLLMDRRASMMQWFDRMGMYGPMMRKVLEDEGAPADLVYLAALISDMLPNAKTKTGGVGWWALGSLKDKKNSSSAPWIVTNDWDDRRDPVLSTRIAATVLQGLLRKDRKTNWLLAICAFVDGADKIDAISDKAAGFSYWDMTLPSYSEVVIPRLAALKMIDTHRAFYGVHVPLLPPVEFDYLDRLKLLKDLPLHVVAKWCGTNARSIWELNPGVDPSTGILPKPDRRSPSGFPLRVPKGMGTKVRKLLIQEGYLQS